LEPVQWPTGLPEEPGVDIYLGYKKTLFAFIETGISFVFQITSGPVKLLHPDN